MTLGQSAMHGTGSWERGGSLTEMVLPDLVFASKATLLVGKTSQKP